MIVVDTNIVSYFYLPSDYSQRVSQLYQHDSVWVAPSLWRSEFRNVLTLYIRKKLLSLEQALLIQEDAESLFLDNEFQVTSTQVLALTSASTCSAYDCEFVALAKQLSVKLITQDKKILTEFPDIAFSISDYLEI
ncbi:MAG: type II toxin-antitoxin system VapC family toxin [Methylobacter sp.]|nr:type II toxin-antitoxin system VapC family toxin [Methylobacter sp.]